LHICYRGCIAYNLHDYSHTSLANLKRVLVGIRPEVAQAIVGLGIDLGRVVTRSSLQSGLAHTTKGW